MTDTMEPLAIKTPTFEQARDAFRGVWAEHRYADDCLLWMLDALHTELADEREIVRGQAAVIASLHKEAMNCRAGITRIVTALELSASAYTLTNQQIDRLSKTVFGDADPDTDYWTVRPDEPENYAANYPAAPVINGDPA